MRTTGLLAGAAALVALSLFATLFTPWGPKASDPANAAGAAAETQLAVEQVELETASGVKVVQAEIARTPDQQAKGLMFRTTLADDRGMLFPHNPPREVTMWMRNTYISLDMVFIRADGVVHRIAARTDPLSEKVISSQGDVAAVLELAGGAAERLGLKPGDKVRHSFFTAR